MGLLSWLRATFSPARVANQARVVQAKPLHEQFQRIGGGLTPADVSYILRLADAGQPERLVDLWNESRQRDGHLQSVCGTRETAVSLVDLDFIEPEDATAKEKEATKLCRKIRDEFKNWPTLIEHLAGAFAPGHATAELRWEKKDGQLLPVESIPLHARDFIFSRAEGALRYRRNPGDSVGVDLLAENPGRIIQVQRRIVGDVPAREGLMRVLIWAALFRNWSLRDWIALGEIGWKPWRRGKYAAGTHQDDVDKLVDALERLGTHGVAVLPDTTDITVDWPKGAGQGQTSHRELFDVIGREMSKATLGQTTTTEAGPNGDRASTETRDKVRGDIREADCRATAAPLRYHMFSPAVAMNLGADVRCPAPWFQTDESADQKEFSEAIKNLHETGLRIPAKWVRDEVGMPEPIEGEEVLEKVQVQVPGDVGGDDDELDIPVDVEEPEDASEDEDKSVATNRERNGHGYLDGQGFVDALVERTAAHGERILKPDLAAITREIEAAKDYEDLRNRLRALYEQLDPEELTEFVHRAVLLAEMAGRAAVNQDA